MSNKYKTKEKRIQDAIAHKNQHPRLSLKMYANKFNALYKYVIARYKGI